MKLNVLAVDVEDYDRSSEFESGGDRKDLGKFQSCGLRNVEHLLDRLAAKTLESLSMS